ncbi:MAG: CHAT domain-containing protein [Caldilineaceae bacterium]
MSQHSIPTPDTLLIVRQNQQFTYVWQAAGATKPHTLAHRQLATEQLQTSLQEMQQLVAEATYLAQPNPTKSRPAKAGNSTEVEEKLRVLGQTLTHQLLPEGVKAYLQSLPTATPFCVVTNDEFLPWELLSIDNAHLAMRHAVSRQPLRTDAVRASDWNPPSQLHCLLIGNPTGDGALAAVEQEIDSLIDLFDSTPEAVKSTVWGYGTTKTRLLHALANNTYQIIHFAGHARPGAILLADGWVEAAEIQAAVNGAPFIFINGCASAQTAGGIGTTQQPASEQPVAPLPSSSLAKAFLLGGASGFIGMLWPVLDGSARQLAVDFYRLALQAMPVGEALRQARWRSRQQGAQQLVWAAPVLYGAPTQKLFTGKPRQQMGSVLVIEQSTRPMSQAEAVACCNVIIRYGGTIVTVTPTQLIALFGVTQPLEDDAERALRAVLALPALPTSANEPKRVAVITSGVIACNDTVSTALTEPRYWGDPITFALQVAHLAQPGEVLVNESVRRLTQRLFHFASALDPAFSRLTSPVYQLHQTEIATLPPLLVDRARELDDLHEYWQAAQRGEGGMVGIAGEAGIGKSALVETFCREPRNQSLHLLSLTANKIEEATPLAFLTTLLRLLLDIPTATDARLVRQQIEQKFSTLPFFAPIVRLVDYLQEVLGFPAASLAPEERKELRAQLLPLITQLLDERYQTAPLVLLWDDAQYIDAESLALLKPLTDVIEGKPVLLFLLYRTGWEHNPWREQAFYTQLNLRPLSEKGAQLLLHQLLETATLPPALQQTLTQLHFLERNPLYLIDWLRYLQEERFLARVNGQWQVVRPLPVETLPESIKRSQLARVHRLMEEPLRPLLHLLAVVETGFTVRLLAEVLDEPDDTIRDRLNQLRKDELVDLSGSKPGRRFSKVMREVLYDALPPDERAVLHRQVADALAGDPSANLFIVAGHYFHSKDRANAVHYALQAAAAAANGWNNTDALLWYERATTKVTALRQRSPTPLEEKRGATVPALESWSRTGLEGCADIHARIGENEQAITLYTNLLATAQLLPAMTLQHQAELWRKVAIAHHDRGQLDQAAEAVTAGLKLLDSNDDNERGRLLLWQSMLLYRRNELNNALTICQQAITQLAGAPQHLAQAYNQQCVLYRRLGRLTDALVAGNKSIALYHEGTDLLRLTRALSNVGIVYDEMGRWQEAQRCYREAYDLATKTGDVRALGSAAIDLCEAYRYQGELERANQMYEVVLQRARLAHDVEIQCAVLINQSVIALKRQQATVAATCLEQSEALLTAANLQLYHAEIARLRAEMHLQQQQPQAAMASAAQALEWAQEANDQSEIALAQRVCAMIYATQGQNTEAEAYFTASVRALREQQRPYELGLTLLAQATWLTDRHQSTNDITLQEAALACCQEAAALFATLGARLEAQDVQAIYHRLNV